MGGLPVCEHKDHEVATCEALAKALKKNGKCSSHEEWALLLGKLTGRVDLILAIQFIIFVLVAAHMGWS